MDDFSVFRNDFETCLAHLTKILEVCVRKRLVLSWEKSHFMVREGVVLGHIVSGKGLELDKAKIEVIQNLPLPNIVKDLRSFLWHVGFYRRFIQDFAKVFKPLTTLLCKDKDFIINEEGKRAFKTLTQALIEAPILQCPNWDLPFEIMCDASDYAVGAVFGQRLDKKPTAICYASKTLIEAQINYTTTEKELLAVVYALEKFRPYILGSKIIIWQRSIFEDAHRLYTECLQCQAAINIFKRDEMPMQPILEVEIFDLWGIDFMGPFPPSDGK